VSKLRVLSVILSFWLFLGIMQYYVGSSYFRLTGSVEDEYDPSSLTLEAPQKSLFGQFLDFFDNFGRVFVYMFAGLFIAGAPFWLSSFVTGLMVGMAIFVVILIARGN